MLIYVAKMELVLECTKLVMQPGSCAIVDLLAHDVTHATSPGGSATRRTAPAHENINIGWNKSSAIKKFHSHKGGGGKIVFGSKQCANLLSRRYRSYSHQRLDRSNYARLGLLGATTLVQRRR